MKIIIQVLIVGVLLTACNQQPKANKDAVEATEKEMANDYSIPEPWVNNRVTKAQERLEKTESGQVIWAAMEAHGGLKNWYGNGALSFRFNYQPLDGSTQRDSYQIVDAWRNKSVHTSTTDREAKFGWTGEKAWVHAKDSTAFAYDTKFWALTPLYLFGYPFVLDGEGVNLELLPDAEYEDALQDVVKVTFDAGTGDAPDDYYILQFDKETHLVTGIRYIVSYPAYFKDGGHAPEKFMKVGVLADVDGVKLPTGLKTHWTLENGQAGEYITKIDITDLEFTKDLSDDFFEIPEGAKIIE